MARKKKRKGPSTPMSEETKQRLRAHAAQKRILERRLHDFTAQDVARVLGALQGQLVASVNNLEPRDLAYLLRVPDDVKAVLVSRLAYRVERLLQYVHARGSQQPRDVLAFARADLHKVFTGLTLNNPTGHYRCLDTVALMVLSHCCTLYAGVVRSSLTPGHLDTLRSYRLLDAQGQDPGHVIHVRHWRGVRSGSPGQGPVLASEWASIADGPEDGHPDAQDMEALTQRLRGCDSWEQAERHLLDFFAPGAGEIAPSL